MANPYKTSGIDIEEIQKITASVTAVATAISAFVGYTKKLKKINPATLILFLPV